METGIWPLFEIEDGKFRLTSTSARIASGEIKRKPVKEYIRRQSRFKHLTDGILSIYRGRLMRCGRSG